MAETTKAKINVKEGTIELEGSESFVRGYLDEFKELLKSPTKVDISPSQDEEPKAPAAKKAPVKKSTTTKSSASKKSAPKVSMERFNIHGDEEVPSLEAYMEEKKPGTGNGNIIAVIGHYITERLGEDNFSEGQIEYAYKMLKINRPNHLRQIMINEKNKRDLFESNAEDNTKWHLTRAGEIFVSDVLPES